MHRVIFKFAFTLLTIIFLFAAFMMSIENLSTYQTIREEMEARDKDKNYKKHDWDLTIDELIIHDYHDMLYYMMVTISTVGFGDISP